MSRQTCNTRKCGLPHPELEGGMTGKGCMDYGKGYGKKGAMDYGMAPMDYGKGMGYAPMMVPMEGGKGGGGGKSSGGDWDCPNCGNHNYGNRETCNTRKCQAPRPFGAGLFGAPGSHWSPPGQATSNVVGAKGDGKAGDWQCPGCGNVNFGKRDTCNTRTCQAPRPVAHFGAPMAMSQDWGFDPRSYAAGKAAGKSCGKSDGKSGKKGGDSGPDWACPSCGNVNFGHRETCNTRKCQLPRPAQLDDLLKGLGAL